MANLTIEVVHDRQANSTSNLTGTIVLGERVFPAPAPSSASIRLEPQDRRFPLLIAGSETSNIWEHFLFPILHQDLSHIRGEENLRRMSGLTVIVPSKELMKNTTDIIRSHGYTGKEAICWDITSAYPWQLNPLDGSAEDAARTMCTLMTGSSWSEVAENRLAEHHVYFHTKLLKILHTHQDEIEAIVHEHLLFQKNAPPLSYQELFQTSACTLDQWLHLYADPYIAKEGTRTLHYLIKQKEKASATSTDRTAVDDFLEDSQKVLSFLSSCYAYKQNDQWKAKRLSQATGTPLYFIDRERSAYVCYPPGHPHEGKWVVFDVYADQISNVISLCMFLSTNTAFRKLMIGQNYINLIEHFERGGILVINTGHTRETVPSRSLFETVLMSKIEQAIFSRSDLTDHSLLIGDATRYLIESNLQERSHFLLRARKTGVFLTMGVPQFSLIRDMCTSTHIENILASFRNRLIFADIYDASVCMLLRMDEPFLHQGPGETHVGHSSLALFRGASEEHFYPVLMKHVPIPPEKDIT